jgi:hypothetical protein
MLRCAFLLGVRGVDIARVNNLVADIGKENHPFSIFFRLLDEGFSPQALALLSPVRVPTFWGTLKGKSLNSSSSLNVLTVASFLFV